MPPMSLFLAIMEVDLGNHKEGIAPATRALVPAFATGETYEPALQAAVVELRSQGYEFLDIQGKVQELDAAQWTNYVQAVWPEFESELPKQSEVLIGLREPMVFFGPFMAYP